MSSKSDILMLPITEFYKDINNIKKMMRIINGKSRISLRILDWFATNYSKKNNIVYICNEGTENAMKFNVFLDYKAQLKAYTKKQFDPFCRNERISFYDHDDNKISTTVGQLNFFRWIINNKVIDYVDEHIDEIEDDMNKVVRNISKDDVKIGCSKETKDDKKRKRHELSVSAVKTVNKHNVKLIVRFD